MRRPEGSGRRGEAGQQSLIEQGSVRLERATSSWTHVKTLPLRFPTFHPQGLVFVGEHAFLSSVEVLEEPQRIPPSSDRTAGRGLGHLFVISSHGELVHDIPLGEGAIYHPGGLDFDGHRIWVPVAEYRERSNTIVCAVDPVSRAVTEMFRVQNHVSWVVSDATNGIVYGADWGSRHFFTWSATGKLLDEWTNPSDFVDYQDCQYLGSGRVVCGGSSALPSAPGADPDGYELGGIAVVNFPDRRIDHETAVALFSPGGHVITWNPLTVTANAGNLFFHVAPDDGDERNGTELLTYKTAISAPITSGIRRRRARKLDGPTSRLPVSVEGKSLEYESGFLRKAAQEAALSVGPMLSGAFRSAMDHDFKRDSHDIVTVHDRASEENISAFIMAAVPDSTIIGEETGERGTGRVRWYIDPIDGTSNFARGIALWCVSIAAVVNGRVVAGVIYDPVAGDVFAADLSGAWLNSKPLIARACEEESAATIVSSFPNAQDLDLLGAEALDVHGTLVREFQAVRNLGSGALNLAHVAAGWADATMGFATNPWDVAAGVLILERAGGSYHGYAAGALASPNFLAPDYYAVGSGANYPTMRGLVERLSARRAAP